MLVRQALTRQDSGFLAAGFTHTLNPYKGCGFGRTGCPFCYVRESPVGKLGPAAWGTWVVPKDNIARVLERELRRPQASQYKIFMASATDPYQPLEVRLALSRQCLEVFRQHPVAWLVVQTRSVLVRRDFALLSQLPFVTLNITLETDLVPVHRALTRSSPLPAHRLCLVQQALAHGIRTQITVAPLLPHSPAFAAALVKAVGGQGRILVDTLIDGDGADGRRSQRLGMAGHLAALGHPDWWARCQEHAHMLAQQLTTSLGQQRVLWSAAGFQTTW